MITYIEDIPRIKPRNLPSSANANAPSGSSRERIVSSGWRTEILQRSSISPCAWIQHTHTHTHTRERERVSLLAPRSHFSQPRDSIRFQSGNARGKKHRRIGRLLVDPVNWNWKTWRRWKDGNLLEGSREKSGKGSLSKPGILIRQSCGRYVAPPGRVILKLFPTIFSLARNRKR